MRTHEPEKTDEEVDRDFVGANQFNSLPMLKYRPEIDGLRGIAVLIVVLFHSGFPILAGGFVGVDIFFVISGYLISTIIITEVGEERFSFLRFYERRARRILPALFFVVVACIPFGWFILQPVDLKDFLKSVASIPIFSSNFLFWSESGYWDRASEMKPLIHTWSISIEEQFYLLFPLLCVFVTRKHKLLATVFVLSAFSLVLAQLGVSMYPAAAFYLLPTRAWELGVGVICAIVHLDPKASQLCQQRRSINESLGILGLAMTLYPAVGFSEITPFPGLTALLPTLGAALILTYAKPHTAAFKFLTNRILVSIGLVSYSLYLWHQPLLVFSRHLHPSGPSPALTGGLLFTAAILSYLSWRYIETPFRSKQKVRTRTIVLAGSAGSFALLTIGLVGSNTSQLTKSTPAALTRIRLYEPEKSVLLKERGAVLNKITGEQRYVRIGSPSDHRMWFSLEDKRKRLLIIGNSHSMDLFNTIHFSEVATENFQLARFGIDISDLVKPDCDLFSSPNYKAAEIVMICSYYLSPDVAVMEDALRPIMSDKKLLVVVNQAYSFSNDSNFTIADLFIRQFLSSGEPETPQNISNLVESINGEYYRNFSESRSPLEEMPAYKKIQELESKYDDLIVLQRMDFILDKANMRCFAINDKLEKYYLDAGHHTLSGARFFGRRVDEINWLQPLLEAIAEKKPE